MRSATVFLLAALAAVAQEPVSIRVDASAVVGPWRPVWSYFGYDEPNYTTAKNGRKLVGELGKLGRVHIRAHNLLTSGDGTYALKWGSTNAYTETADGTPVYDWKIVDQIFDTWVRAGITPFVEIGFMPEALSTKPEPYRHAWPTTPIAAGWAYPPKDYQKWAELVRQWVRHEVARYGLAEVETWSWEVWNEPDIEYWQGTPEEYDKMYDFAARAVKGVSLRMRVGGPATTGPDGRSGAAFLRQFLEYCARTGAPLDFVSYHAKGRPEVAEGHVRMGLARNLQDVAAGLDILTSFPQYRNLPIILSESDPEGCAACSARTHPQNAYRNGALYPCYTAVALSSILKLADRYKANIEGMLTWAFEFEDQPYFDGFRTLATNGIDKPVLNLFRMAGLMQGNRVRVESSGAVSPDDIVRGGVREKPDIDALATKWDRGVSVLVWNYHDDDVAAPDASVSLALVGLPSGVKRVQVRHYRIDADHSNAWTGWKQMGSPQNPTPEQYARLEAAGQLQMLGSEQSMAAEGGRVNLSFSLPREAVSLVQVSW
ncbi:MAG: beta-xylosidase [Bryobacteraceae bacterium]|jgi:xylan 1,4-beta-xylosidase